jgi:signal transduction histidine kinase
LKFFEMESESDSERDRLIGENARLRGDLLTIGCRITHDLRTPIGGILAAMELLKETFAREPSSMAAVDSLVNSVDELNRLIKSIGVFAKATARPLPKEKVAMGEIVSGIMQQLESRILKRGATVSAPDSWPEVAGVSGWLEFVWWNFLANALQHGGLKIQLGWHKEKNEFRFWISDTGGGVCAPLRAKLFQPFDSLHQPDSTRGVSLSIVQRLVALQGGRCGYEVDPEGGPCFYFTLPLAELPAASAKVGGLPS